MNITITKDVKQRPKDTELGFGTYFSDHMFVMDYNPEKGWHNPTIMPYAPIELDPSSMVLHYAQALFEGLKAYKAKDGRVLLFRPQLNFKRMNLSCERLAVPPIDEDFCRNALIELIKIDKDRIPSSPGTSLYIRPFIIATDPFLGVRPSITYKYIVILSPSGMYYTSGLNPVKILVEDKYVRAVRGGMGYVKTAGNYAASIKAQQLAQEKGYSQVLWLDGVEQKYVEEVGSMNVFFVIGDTVVTPDLNNGSILGGITRISTIELLRKWGHKVEERRLSIDEVMSASDNGELKEVFGTGTAAVISPVGELNYLGKQMIINDSKTGALTSKLYDTLTGIQYGDLPDELNWTVEIK